MSHKLILAPGEIRCFVELFRDPQDGAVAALPIESDEVQRQHRIGAVVVLREMAAEIDDLTRLHAEDYSDALHDVMRMIEARARELEADNG